MSLFHRFALPWFLLWRALATPVAVGTLAVVENGEGKVLLVRQSYSSGWVLPGGGMDRGEPPDMAILRELREEIGLVRSDPPLLLGLHTRKLGLATNVVALFRVRNAVFEFKPSLEIRAAQFFDPANPPADAQEGTKRRLAELTGKTPPSPYW
jgi:8-oxo-dGTP pyrophosphatase MutT (NUDIX family)